MFLSMIYFFFIKDTDICNFADDATLCACGKDLDSICNNLKLETNTALQRLKDKEMVPNPSKFHLIFLSKYKNIKRTYLLKENSLNHQVQLNYLK